MKFSKMIDQEVIAEDGKIGKIKDLFIDEQKWEVTHLEIQLTKEAANEILGAKTSIRNMLAISALRKGTACCTNRGIEIKRSKAQLHLYLRPSQ